MQRKLGFGHYRKQGESEISAKLDEEGLFAPFGF
jgi:hypothetical protein